MLLRLKTVKQLAALSAIAIVTTANAVIISVPGDFNTIQAAINTVSNGDEVLVAPDTYVENLNIEFK